MSKVVIILGAGASQHTGAPLMKDFMRQIRNISEMENIQCIDNDYKLIMKAHSLLDQKRSKVLMEYEDNIELLFGSLEMAKLVGSLGGLSKKNIANLPDTMRRVICHTIDRNITLSINGNGDIINFNEYLILVKMIKRLIDEKNIYPTIITFNYDICLELILKSFGINIDYGIETNNNDAINYYKLHGSINWIDDRINKSINIINIEDILNNFKANYKGPKTMNILENYFIKNGKWIYSPFIVPPTWNKTSYHNKIDKIWKNALLELSDVRHLFIIGYSFPHTDLFFRHMLALGMTSTILDTFMVIDISYDPVKRIQEITSETIRELVISSIGGGGFSQQSINQMEAIIS